MYIHYDDLDDLLHDKHALYTPHLRISVYLYINVCISHHITLHININIAIFITITQIKTIFPMLQYI